MKEKEENIWKRKSGKTFGEENEMRNQKKEKEEGMMEGKYFFVEEKK